MKARVNLLGGKLFEYIPHCLGLLDKGVNNFEIHAFGGSSNQALVLAQMLSKLRERNTKYNYDAKIYESKTKFSALNSLMTTIELDDRNKLMKTEGVVKAESLIHNGFIDFSTYHLLFQNALSFKESIKISVELYPNGGKTVDLLEIKPLKGKDGQYELEVLLDTSKRNDKIRKFQDRLCEVLYRAGYLLPQDWEEIGMKLTNYDDIIVGLDTCVLKDTFITTGLLPILSVIEKSKYVQTPNWMLFVIPQMVIYELEKASNMKRERGHFAYPGRRGFRALQEIMELRKNVSHKGVSVVNTGNADAMLDVNSFLKSMNENLIKLVTNGSKSSGNYGSRTPKSASGDMLIRSQFNTFVDGINFKKGTYFLTSDKINAAMYTTSGNEAIYIPKPVLKNQKIIQSPQLIPKVDKTIPLGTLLYELAVDYGKLYMHLGENEVVKLECDLKGKSLTPWIRKQLRMSHQDMSTMLDVYTGKFDLTKVREFYKEIAEQLEKIDWKTDVDLGYK